MKSNDLVVRTLGYKFRGVGFENNKEALRLTKLFMILGLIKCVPGFPGDLVLKSNLSNRSGFAALRHVHAIHKNRLCGFLVKAGPSMLQRQNQSFSCKFQNIVFIRTLERVICHRH